MTIHPSLARSLLPRQTQCSGAARYADIPYDQKHTILEYFLSLNQRDRRTRFGIAASDGYIYRYLAGVDWRYYAAFACRRTENVLALVELFGDAETGWRRPELAISVAGTLNPEQVRAELLQIAFLAAHARGATDIIIHYEPAEEWVPALAAEYGGTLDSHKGIAVLPVGDDLGACRPDDGDARASEKVPGLRCVT
jgi:hypothetical protein